MTQAGYNLLNAFDALEPNEQQSIAAEILRRTAPGDELTDEAFDELAAAVFQGYDAEEAGGADA